MSKPKTIAEQWLRDLNGVPDGASITTDAQTMRRIAQEHAELLRAAEIGVRYVRTDLIFHEMWGRRADAIAVKQHADRIAAAIDNVRRKC